FPEGGQGIACEIDRLQAELSTVLELVGLSTISVHHRGHANLTSVAVTSVSDVRQFRYAFCGRCDYAFRPALDECVRCGHSSELASAVEAADVLSRAAVGALRGREYVAAGLGAHRTIALVAETLCAGKRVCWPRSICPFEVNVVIGNMGVADGMRIAQYLCENGYSVIVDDRSDRFGRKLFDAKCLAAPLEIIFTSDGRVELNDKFHDKRLVVAPSAAGEATIRILEEQ
ncbi:MAG: hypothetical protein ACRDQ5_10815, partial [Sciscionella sp.]